MKNIPIRLGPLALLLCVISICMTSLSMLSVANASADMRLAKRYAETVEARYLLEQRGQEFLKQMNEQSSEEVIEEEFTENGYQLQIRLERSADGYEIDYWKISKIWEEPTQIDHLWEG